MFALSLAALLFIRLYIFKKHFFQNASNKTAVSILMFIPLGFIFNLFILVKEKNEYKKIQQLKDPSFELTKKSKVNVLVLILGLIFIVVFAS
jgi:glucan phosphoethanolaminetransferase (alkaline phosphatase superfamily)